jgi:hypothetical protein
VLAKDEKEFAYLLSIIWGAELLKTAGKILPWLGF